MYNQEPTRVSTSSFILIDHVLCSQDISVSKATQATGVSDHRIQIVEFKVPPMKIVVPSCFVCSLTKWCYDDVCSFLSHAPWSVLNILPATLDL